MTDRRGATLVLVAALVVGTGCGSDHQRAATSIDLEADGDGPANDEALLPLALGYRVERATRVMVVAERSDRFGEPAWVLSETLPTVPTNAPDRTPTTWWLAERDDGLSLLAVDGEALPKPARLVPRHLHAGDRWVFRDGSGKVFGAARALGGEEADTVFGRRKVFTIAFVRAAALRRGAPGARPRAAASSTTCAPRSSRWRPRPRSTRAASAWR
ncbi:MAG: hypothetical protein U1F43_26395 [Myxococcota bacterium]